jgi:hypothetical protein
MNKLHHGAVESLDGSPRLSRGTAEARWIHRDPVDGRGREDYRRDHHRVSVPGGGRRSQALAYSAALAENEYHLALRPTA